MAPRPPVPPRVRAPLPRLLLGAPLARLLLGAPLLLLPLLRTPTHPDYPCGHCGTAAATAAVLEAETGPAPAGGIRIVGHDHSPGLALAVPTWAAFVEAMSMSRIHAGAHTRFANEDAESMGREVARRALRRFATTVATP